MGFVRSSKIILVKAQLTNYDSEIESDVCICTVLFNVALHRFVHRMALNWVEYRSFVLR